MEGSVNVSYNDTFCACMHTLRDYTLMSLFLFREAKWEKEAGVGGGNTPLCWTHHQML